MQDRPKRMRILFTPAAASYREALWSPKADIYQAADGWILKFDLAGVRPEDVNVEVAGRTVRVRGARRDWVQTEGWHYHSMEISYSRFARSIDLPALLDESCVESEYRDGMFIVRVRARETGK